MSETQPKQLKGFETFLPQGSFADVMSTPEASEPINQAEWRFLGNDSPITKIIFDQTYEPTAKEKVVYKDALSWIKGMLPTDWEFNNLPELNRKLKSLTYQEKYAANNVIKDYCAATYRLARTPSAEPGQIDPMDYVIADGLRTAGDFFLQEKTRLELISKGARIKLNREIMQNPEFDLDEKEAERIKTEAFCTHIERLVATLERQNEVKNAATFLELLQIFADGTRNPKARYEAWAHLIAAHRSIVQECNAVEKNGVMDEITSALVKGGFFNYDRYFDEIHGRSVYSLHDRKTGRCLKVAYTEGILKSDAKNVVLTHEMPPRNIGLDNFADRAAYTGDPKRKIPALAKDSIKNGLTIDDTHRMRINAETPQAAMRIAREIYTALKIGGASGYIDTEKGLTQTLAPDGIDINTRFGHFTLPYTQNGHNQNTSNKREVIQFDWVTKGRRVEMQIYTTPTYLNSEYDIDQFHEGYYIKKLFNGQSDSTILRMFPDQYIQHTQLEQLRLPPDEITPSLHNSGYRELMILAAHAQKFSGDEYQRYVYFHGLSLERFLGRPATRLLRRIDEYFRRTS